MRGINLQLAEGKCNLQLVTRRRRSLVWIGSLNRKS